MLLAGLEAIASRLLAIACRMEAMLVGRAGIQIVVIVLYIYTTSVTSITVYRYDAVPWEEFAQRVNQGLNVHLLDI